MKKKKHILLIEDETDTRQAITEFLRAMGYGCVAFASGQEVLKCFKPPVDLAIIDMNLPQMNGFDVYEKLLKQQTHLPAIMVTAFGNYQTWGKSVDYGFFDIISKPFDFDELLVVIERALKLHATTG